MKRTASCSDSSPIADKIDLFTGCAVAPKDADGVARVTSIKRRVGQTHANLHKMRASKIWWREVVDFESLQTRATTILAIEEIALSSHPFQSS